ncbi:phosphotransferase family protein [Ornithinimicrobium cerasi]|uniref:phosphotransferase family protein n=1 Tax=Ornithinimicrobium cerasi TaxID=2248773 RepID=UPI000F00FC60|nr:phosphotransferase [Ornithinimicrobium cerasi]
MGRDWRERSRRVGGAVLRRARRGLTAPAPPAPPVTTPQQRQDARVEEALAAVGAVEASDAGLPATTSPVALLALDRVVRRPDLPARLTHLVPASLRGSWEGRAGVRPLEAPVAADAVVLAKFDLGSRVKLRAGYAEAGLALAVQPRRADGTSGVTGAARSAEMVNRHVPGLAPTLHAVGTLDGGYDWLVEDWVEGEPLVSDHRLAAHLDPLLERLAELHRGHGVRHARPAEVWGESFLQQWGTVRDEGLVSDAVGGAVARLVAADRLLRVSWTHGDLAASNVLLTDRGLVVIDWEHAAERPVMYDGARLHLFAADPARTVGRIRALWGGEPARSTYPPEQELAILHARLVCNAPRRLARLADHPRREIYVRQLARQTDLLAGLLELPPGPLPTA